MIKPILFNTDMVRALLANRKTATRLGVKPRYSDSVFEMFKGELWEASPPRPPRDNGDGTTTRFVRAYYPCRPPYRPGDILYVRETFFERGGHFYYKADGRHEALEKLGIRFKWRPSIHMPREAARIFLRVTDVRAERLQDITEEQAKAEGAIDNRHFIHDSGNEYDTLHSAREHFAEIWNACYAKPRPIKGEDGTIDHYESYPWEDIQETRAYKGKPWYVIGNPWVWVIEFERISREKVM